MGFSFNNTINAQVDGIYIGSTLCPVLSFMFVDFYESFFFEKYCKPYLYLHYIDSTFSILGSINDVEAFHTQNISFNLCIQFTTEVKKVVLCLFGAYSLNLKVVRSLPVFIVSLHSHVYTPTGIFRS